VQAADSVAGVLWNFQYLVVEERIDPEAVHKAFMAIDEYAQLFGLNARNSTRYRATSYLIDGERRTRINRAVICTDPRHVDV